MAQIFQPSVSLTLKLLLIALLLAIAVSLFSEWNAMTSPGMDAPIAQPIAFSHKHTVATRQDGADSGDMSRQNGIDLGMRGSGYSY